MTRPYDLLLLDFGGVCLLHPAELHHVAERKLGLPRGTFTWLGPLDPATDDLWVEMTQGSQLREREYWERRASDVGEAIGQQMTVAAYMGMLFNPPTDDLIRPGCRRVVAEAKDAGLSVSILTNDLRAFHGPKWQEAISMLRVVDHIVDCSDLGVLKPDHEAFRHALDVTGHRADRVLFVDDQPLSVESAQAYGIDGLFFDIARADECWDSVAHLLGL